MKNKVGVVSKFASYNLFEKDVTFNFGVSKRMKLKISAIPTDRLLLQQEQVVRDQL